MVGAAKAPPTRCWRQATCELHERLCGNLTIFPEDLHGDPRPEQLPSILQRPGVRYESTNAKLVVSRTKSLRPSGADRLKRLISWDCAAMPVGARSFLGVPRARSFKSIRARPVACRAGWLVLATGAPAAARWRLEGPSAPTSRRTRRLGPLQVSGSRPTGSR